MSKKNIFGIGMKKIEIAFKKENVNFNRPDFQELYIQCGYSQSSMEKILTNSHKILLAYHNDAVIGFITTLSNGENYVYYDKIGVRKDYRGRGIGWRLFAFMTKYYKNVPVHSLLAKVDSVKFYEKFGFRIIGEKYENENSIIIPMLKINKVVSKTATRKFLGGK
ncbi:MAG: putative acetyltransferase [Spirochaetes bacterium ADurb.Bin133]|jgi:ribosomal protein S18 acetylase RimI-like enzyme|nr:MAG: putative acetyltransferase [Spirochaetes bacterium ADurb.Bin133]